MTDRMCGTCFHANDSKDIGRCFYCKSVYDDTGDWCEWETDYIGRTEAIKNVIDQLRVSSSEECLRERLLNLRPADVASRYAYDMIDWERCVAITQLKEIGKGLGERMDDVRRNQTKQAKELESPKWISVGDLMPAEETDVLVMFEHNMAVANWDGSAWMVNSGDGWCTGISLDDDEKEPTHWMPLPDPPKEMLE